MCARRVMNVCAVLGVCCRENVCYFDVVYRCGVERDHGTCVIMPSKFILLFGLSLMLLI